MSVTRRIYCTVRILGILSLLICGVEVRGQNSDAEKTNLCPEIVVVGPAGVSDPGQLVRFEVSVKPNPPANLTFHWTTSAGQVDDGQFTKQIGVRYLMEMRGTNLIATVKIAGLPINCPNSASGSAPLVWDPGAELLSEFSIPIASIHPRALTLAADERKNHPREQIYIIEYFPVGTSERAIKRKKDKIMAFMAGNLRIDPRSVTIVTADADRPRTKIFRIPLGAANPTP